MIPIIIAILLISLNYAFVSNSGDAALAQRIKYGMIITLGYFMFTVKNIIIITNAYFICSSFILGSENLLVIAMLLKK